MEFLNRKEEMKRLKAAQKKGSGAFIVIWGRQRVGKTRLLLEWLHGSHGLYWVANESVSKIQRNSLAKSLAEKLPGFDEVEYGDWESFFKRLAREIEKSKWRGPLVIDEFPYLVSTAPELPSILQGFVDHELKKNKFILAIAGSSQRMMQGLVLDSNAPLYGRAQELLPIRPVEVNYIKQALSLKNSKDTVKAHSVWGGIPRYWNGSS